MHGVKKHLERTEPLNLSSFSIIILSIKKHMNSLAYTESYVYKKKSTTYKYFIEML